MSGYARRCDGACARLARPLVSRPAELTCPPLVAFARAGQRQVATVEGKGFAEAQNIPFLETSAKTGTFVDTAFLMMAHEIKNKMTAGTSGGSRSTGLSGGDGDKKGCC